MSEGWRCEHRRPMNKWKEINNNQQRSERSEGKDIMKCKNKF